MRDHRNLLAFQLVDALVIDLYRATKSIPREEKFVLSSQLRRTVVSIASYIVEGRARESQPDFVGFLEIAFASAQEVEYQLTVAARVEYLPADLAESLNQQIVETSKVLYGLI